MGVKSPNYDFKHITITYIVQVETILAILNILVSQEFLLLESFTRAGG